MKTTPSIPAENRRSKSAAQISSAVPLTRRPLSTLRASTAAPGLREVRLWELPEGSVGRCELRGEDSLTLTGVSGHCWVTMEGDRDDYLLQPEDRLDFTGPGVLVFEAVAGAATVAVQTSVASDVAAVART